MEKTYANGVSPRPRSIANKTDEFTFFAELKKSFGYSDSKIKGFCERWAIDIENLVDKNGIQKKFLDIRNQYMPLIRKFVDQESLISTADLEVVNRHLSDFKLKLIPSPATINQEIQKMRVCHKGDSFTNAIGNLVILGHPDHKKDIKIKFDLVDQVLGINRTLSWIPLSAKNINEIISLKESGVWEGSEIKDDFSIASMEKDSSNDKTFHVVLSIGEQTSVPRDYAVNEIISSIHRKMDLESTIFFMLWHYVQSLNTRNVKLCIVCGRPVSRSNSSYCSRQICKQKIRAKRNFKK